jgi:hypothetical protein
MTAEASPDSYTENSNGIEHKDVDDSSSQGSMDTDYRNWESTPPSSPERPSSQTPDPDLTINASLAKMSLDFIAPGAQANSTPSPVSSTHTTSELNNQDATPVQQNQLLPPAINVATTSSPNPARPIFSEIPHFSPPPPPTPSTRPSCHNLNLPPLAPNNLTPRRYKRSTRRPNQRKDRYTYDTEEKYAIIYLRVIKNLEWNKVLLSFNSLFPPGEPRRCYIPSSPGAVMGGSEGEHPSLPSRYTQRNVQGLQCRWYRIRQEEGLVKLRESRRVGFLASSGMGWKEKRVLERMERAGEVGRKFLKSLNGDVFCAKL